MTELERFEAKYCPEALTGCWLWLAGQTRHGYGSFRAGPPSGEPMLAHRFSYEAYVGPIPKGLHVCHHCDTPACVNPDHLFLGTDADNMSDKTRKGRAKKKLTEDDVLAIRSSKKNGRQLALEYGVSNQSIYRIKLRQSWKHV